MKKKLTGIIAFVAVATLFTGCNDTAGALLELPRVEFNVWTMPSVERVLRDIEYPEYYTQSPALSYAGAANEYESGQILFTTDDDVAFYDLKVRDLVSENGDRIFASDMQVFNQRYTQLRILTASSSGRPLGYYPDALIPMQYAKQAGENAFKTDGKTRNQGLWIRIKTRETTPAGVYTGKFTLTVNDETVEIPVTYEVYDFVLTNENHVKNSFNLFQEGIAGGQLSGTNETYTQVVDTLLDYRVCTNNPCFDNPSDEDYVATYKKYAADERYSAYNVQTLEEVKLLVENSTPELNLIDKAFMYLMDEPFNELPRAEQRNKDAIDGLIALANSYTLDELESFGLTRSDIEGIETLITLTDSIGRIDGLRTWCPLVSDYDTQAMRDKYAWYRENAYKGANGELEGKDYGTTWFYYCVHPHEPHANINIDMDLVASRAVSWMQYGYDVEGQLYWGTATYRFNESIYDYTNGWEPCDVYENPLVYPAANGDGILLYPGMKYGVEEFFPSIRLEALRDGFEDYEYLYALENAMEKYSQKYGVTDFNFDSLMKNIYDSVFTGTVANSDYTRILEAKSAVASMIELISSNAHAIVEVGEIDAVNSSVPFTVYAKAGTKLSFNGEVYEGTPSGDGVKFALTQTLGAGKNYLRLTFINGTIENEYKVYLSAKVSAVSYFNTQEDIEKWTASERLSGENKAHIELSYNDDPAYLKEGAGSMKASFKACAWTGAETVDYTPYIRIAKEHIVGNDSLKDLNYIEFAVYNAGEEFTLTVDVEAQDGTRTRTKRYNSYLVGHGWNIIRITGLSSFTWTVSGNEISSFLSAIRIGIPLEEADRTLYFDKVYCEYIG